uniref:Uncharacterized protein n=1 Tax=Rhizophora mucronata TaxID=61149 RepID=A0A2P2KSE3_RHIMU
MIIVGEPVEKLFLWGHSSCTLNLADHNEILVFGGFGGIGRHDRRNDSLLLDPVTGALKAIDLEGAPTSRLGHTASLVGDFVFIIGGRADPVNILGDVWGLNTTNFESRLLECTGSLFPPRHRHAAAVDGSNIYVFGGLNNDTIFSSLHILSTESLQWKEVLIGGEQPCARHSHAMVVYRSKLFLFGGYNGEKALGDLYSFDIQTCDWKKEKPLGRSPHARFSHSMFVYNNFIGVIGGCPVRKHSQELALLDMQLNMWKHVMLDFIGRELFVRCTANIVGDDLIMLGGGAACYAFGTKFSEPFKTTLLPLMSLEGKNMGLEVGAESVAIRCDGTEEENDICNQDLHGGSAETSIQSFDLTFESGKHQLDATHWVVQVERRYAKLGKDILKKLGWLDLGRKVYGQKDGLHICFPITEKLSSALLKKQHQYGDAFVGHNDALISNSLVEGNLPNDFSCLTAFSLLKECGATLLPDEAIQLRTTVKSSLQIMNESVASLIGHKGLSEKLLEQIPARLEVWDSSLSFWFLLGSLGVVK